MYGRTFLSFWPSTLRPKSSVKEGRKRRSGVKQGKHDNNDEGGLNRIECEIWGRRDEERAVASSLCFIFFFS
jgi:hypothetical protein